jgi:proton-translocating NADH-quinone oxidoreductase chain L
MYFSVITTSIFSSLFVGLLGKWVGREASVFISILMLLISLVLAIIISYEILLNNNIIYIKLYDLLIINDIRLSISFLFDSLTSIMLLVVLGISSLVHIFTGGYMSHDPFIVRFYSYLSLFTFFMIILITADNFIQLFIGWEGVGVCSYLLINFWFNRILANKAAIKAMLMNRIADVFFIFGIILILIYFKSLNYIIIFSLIDFINNYNIYVFFWEIKIIDLILFFLFLGAIGKSAQIGLHTWLPDAMEGPTPVSSLLHAATMVTAGVFLLVRCSFIFEKSNFILFLIIIIGSCTALFSSIIATYQYDIKKIIAYSTCSQLGYMFFSSGLSNYNITLFHLFNHAFFKALLFLGAGSIISTLLDEQDMRKMGGLIYKIPFTYLSILIGSLAIMGFPFLTGFYSKDILLESTLVAYSLDSLYIYVVGVLTAFFTAVYSFKLIFFVFFIKTNVYNKKVILVESNNYILIPLFVLSISSIFIGYLFSEIFLGVGNNYINNSIFINFEHYNNIEIEFLRPLVKNIPLILTLLGIFFSYRFFVKSYYKSINTNNKYYIIKKNIYATFYNAGFFNFFYNRIFLYLFKIFYTVNVKNIEKGFFELYGPVGLYLLLRKISYNIRLLSSPFVNISLLLIYLNIIGIFYYVIIVNIISIKIIYMLIIIYYIIF